MKAIEVLFWIFFAVVFYTYIGYGMVLYILVLIKRIFGKRRVQPINNYEPDVTLLIAAYNEKDFVGQKVQNSRMLDYPSYKLHQLWVTDGSDDGTPNLLESYPEIKVLHSAKRNGKIAAMNRGMKHVETPIVIFSDANTLLGEKSVRKIVELFADPKTGCVSGEKRIMNKGKAAAAGAGEGLYWKYESTLKKWDAELNSVVGAAGELFSIRTKLYQEVEADTLLDDFIISLRVAMKGYSIQYDPEAYAAETASANVKEELKRKIRIAAGGIQSVIRLYPLLNIFKYGILSFQYISHRVLRWTITPLLLPLLLVLNFLLINEGFYTVLFIAQLAFYISALVGWMLERKKIKIKSLFVPYYFFIMNYAVYRGFFRFLQSSQSVNWERAKRG
jgi:cellulose synthase/poly-beta-1,6-N-acetylglucosamine synthase-like glycosyltransferase